MGYNREAKLRLAQSAVEELATWSDVKLKTMRELAYHIQGLQAALPDGSNGPTAYIDAQAVMEELIALQGRPLKILDTSSTTTDDVLRLTADPDYSYRFVKTISYLDGYAVVPDTSLPFWERLDGEMIDCYSLFKCYRDQQQVLGTRSLARTSTLSGVPLNNINALSKIYHWTNRAKAFDAYTKLEIQAKRIVLIAEMENKHQEAAADLFEVALEYIREHSDELSPKTALEWFNTAIQLERLSLGLDPTKNSNPTSPGGSTAAQTQFINNIQLSQTNPTSEKQNGNVAEDSDGNKITLPNNIDSARLQEILTVLQVAGALPMGQGEGQDTDQNEGVPGELVEDPLCAIINLGSLPKVPNLANSNNTTGTETKKGRW